MLMFIFNICISYGMGNIHYLKNDWYKEEIIGVQKSDITSITFLEKRDEEFNENDYEYVWELDNTGLRGCFVTDTDLIISIPNGDILKTDRNANGMFSFYNDINVDIDKYYEETGLDWDKAYPSIIKSNLNVINNIDLLDTSNVEDMSYMFYNLNNLKQIDLSYFNTSKVNNMSHMFEGMTKLQNIDISSFDTQNVTDMNSMFKGLSNIKSIDLKNINTQNVTNMNQMFKGMIDIEEIDISHFNTDYVKDIGEIFADCKNIKKLIINNLYLINASSNVYKMFDNCFNIKSLDFTNVKLPEDISYLFSGISSNSLDIYNIDTKNVINMNNLFRDCKRIKNINVSLVTDNVEDMSYMFANCESLLDINSFKLNTKKVKNMSYMFSNCKSLKIIDTKNYNTENVIDMTSMFSNCRDLEKLDLSSFNTKSVNPNKLYEMLLNLRGLEELNISGNYFVLNYVDNSYNKNGEEYYSFYNFSLKDLTKLKKIKINEEIAKRAFDLGLFGSWRNVNTNTISNIKYNEVLNGFIGGEYELVPSCHISFEPKNLLHMYDMNFIVGESLNTNDDILKIDEYNNVYYNEGYEFLGWYLDDKFQNRAPSILKIEKDTVLYAKINIKNDN